MPAIRLPTKDGGLEEFITSEPLGFPETTNRPFNRTAMAAAHVVPRATADNDPWMDAELDWDRTIAYRKHLWGLGLGVAEAMDTAQRGMGLDWPTSLELIRRSIDASKDIPGAGLASGAGPDHLSPSEAHNLDDGGASIEGEGHKFAPWGFRGGKDGGSAGYGWIKLMVMEAIYRQKYLTLPYKPGIKSSV